MADTLPNVDLPKNTWVNLYDNTGIPVGTQILAQNIGVCDVYLASQLTLPAIDTDAYQILLRSQSAVNDPGDAGAWAYCYAGGAVNVRLAF